MEIKIWMHFAVGLCLRNHGVLSNILIVYHEGSDTLVCIQL